jgi:hypothetical protein
MKAVDAKRFDWQRATAARHKLRDDVANSGSEFETMRREAE